MGKDPAFLFYPNDWLGGTLGMTFEEKGAYMELLMLQFNRGHMTTDMIGHTVGLMWDKLQHKFIMDDNGLYYNERLEKEIKKRQNYCVSRIKNKEGINQYTNKPRSYDHTHDQDMTSHMTGHMENENIINNIGGVGDSGKPKINAALLSVVKEYTQDEQLVSAICVWITMRARIKKPIEVRGLKMALKKLDGLTGNKIELVDYATMQCWQSFYQPQEYQMSFGQQSKGGLQNDKPLPARQNPKPPAVG